MLRLRLVSFSLFALLIVPALNADAPKVGADPAACQGDNSVCTQHMQTYSFASLTEGNVAETYSVASVSSAFGPTMMFNLIYNSYNADTTRAAVDTGVGFGWTHTYNDFLFTQDGNIFRWAGDGRVTKFSRVGNIYQSAAGYFETLAANSGTSFTLTTKYKTKYRYQAIPSTHFSVGGQQVFRLASITDRNNNVTTLAYSAGNLVSITDTFGRRITLAYDANNHLSSVTDPLGRATNFAYDATGAELQTITDPLGKTTSYLYNNLFQITSKNDRDGRHFGISYSFNLPQSETDANGGTVYAISNTSNWETDHNQLLENDLRVYVPSNTIRVDGRGNDWQYSYDGNGFPLTIIAPDGAVTTYAYDPATLRVASVTDCNGHAMHYQYDAQGNLIQSTDANGNVTSYTYEPAFNQMTSMTDPNGRATNYAYDGHGNRTSETDPLGQTAHWTYDSHGNVLTATDKRGNTTTNVYDAAGNLSQMSDPLNEVTQYAHDGVGNRTSMTDPNGHTTSYQYDGLNRLTLETNAQGGTRQYSYDGENDKTRFTDENNNLTRYDYDQRRRLVTITDALQKPTSYTYDGNNNRLSMTDRNMHTTNYAYDVHNRLILTTDPLGNTFQRSYDCAGNLLSQTDANGHTSSFLYDPLNRIIQKTDALNEITTLGYDLTGLPSHPECTGPTLGSNKVTKRVDGNGKVIYLAYDGLDRDIIDIHKQGGTDYRIGSNDAVIYTTYDANSNRTAKTEPDGNTITYGYDSVNRAVHTQNAAGDATSTGYDAASNLTSVNHPNANLTTYGYDSLNRRTSETDSAGVVFTYGYDSGGNLLSKTDAIGNTATYSYDGDNRLLKMKDPLCVAHAVCKGTVYAYDAGGNKITETDFNGKMTTFVYDADDRQTSALNALGNTTHTAYDGVGNVVERIDGNMHTTSYGYDAQNQKISETFDDPDHNTVFFTYDQVGKVITRTDQKNQITSYTYSDLYFLISRAYPISGTDNFTYDLSGRMLSASRGGWVDTFTYDGANRITQSVQNGHTVAYAYNIPGRTRTVTYPGGRVVTEQMDARDREANVNDGGGTAIVQYSYDAADNVLNRALRNGTQTAYAHNQNYWITQLTDSRGSTQFLGFQYSYDAEGNKNFEKKLHDPSHSEGYVDNSIYELTDFKVGTLSGGVIQHPLTESTWDLDAVHNWNSRTTDGNPQVRTHTNSNEIASIDGNPFLSDFDGNLTDDGVSLYSYDEENRITMVQDKVSGHINQQNQYDALNRRISTIDTFGSQTFYYYDGWRTIEEQSSTGVTQATYVFGNLADEVLTMDRGGASFYYHTNALGSIVALTDSTGNAVEAYQYDAYGYQTVIQPGPNGIIDYGGDDTYIPGGKSFYDNPFLFTAQRYDSSSGLMYYKNRYYSTALGRFMTRDPIGIWSDPVELGNGYAYVGNSPTNITDTTGLDARVNSELEGGGPPPPPPSTCISFTCCWHAEIGPCGLAATGSGSGTNWTGGDNWGVLAPSDGPSSGNGWIGTQDGWGWLAPSGGPSSGDYIVQKLMDAATPKLFEAACKGTHLKEVSIEMVRAGGDPVKYMEIKLKEVMISGVIHNADATGDSQFPTESINLTYGAIEQTYTKQKPDGTAAGNVAAKWNVAQGAAAIAVAPGSGSGIIGSQDQWGCLVGSCRANPQYTYDISGTTKMEFNLKTMKASAIIVMQPAASGRAVSTKGVSGI